MKFNLCTLDWVAIGSIATALMAIATFWTLYNNRKQFKELQKQNVESTLFNLLKQVKNLLNEVTFDRHNGSAALNSAYIKHLQPIETEHDGGPLHGPEHTITKDLPMELMNDKYAQIYKNTIPNIGSYFRSLYRLIKFIDESNFTDIEKYQYTSFVRAQLTDMELIWLFYNCSSHFGNEKFKPLIEKYALLKNIPFNKLLREEHETWYNTSAYKR